MRTGRRFLILMTVVTVAWTGAAACGEATLKEFVPTPTPPTELDGTFRYGVLPVFQTKDCASANCHSLLNPSPSGNLILGGGVSNSEIYQALQDGGSSGSSIILMPTTNIGLSLILTKPLQVTGSETAPDHTGGRFWNSGSDEYLSIKAWITSGAQFN